MEEGAQATRSSVHMGSDRLDVRHRGRDGGKRHHQMMAVCSAPFRLLPRPSGLAVRPEVGACSVAYRIREINLDFGS